MRKILAVVAAICYSLSLTSIGSETEGSLLSSAEQIPPAPAAIDDIGDLPVETGSPEESSDKLAKAETAAILATEAAVAAKSAANTAITHAKDAESSALKSSAAAFSAATEATEANAEASAAKVEAQEARKCAEASSSSASAAQASAKSSAKEASLSLFALFLFGLAGILLGGLILWLLFQIRRHTSSLHMRITPFGKTSDTTQLPLAQPTAEAYTNYTDAGTEVNRTPGTVETTGTLERAENTSPSERPEAPQKIHTFAEMWSTPSPSTSQDKELDKTLGANNTENSKPILSKTSWSVDNLPQALRQPYPSICKETTLNLAEQEDIIKQTRQDIPAFDELCRLLREGKNRHAQRLFMQRSAEKFLSLTAEEYHSLMIGSAGDKSCASLLLKANENDHFWFVGDLHGSLDAFFRLFAYVLHQSKYGNGHDQHTLILLGDIVDRGAKSLETLALILHLMLHPIGVKIITLRGNHDGGIKLHKGIFTSSVSPAEVIGELNFMLSHEEEDLHKLGNLMGRAAIRLAELSPVMGEISGLHSECPEHTILCTHGGVLHTDKIAKLQAWEKDKKPDLAATNNKPYLATIPEELREDFAEDYTWIRLDNRIPRRQPNRGSKGCQMGTLDVGEYRLQHWNRCGRAISFIIRGHDHESAGWALYSYDEALNPATNKFIQRNCGVLTINAMDRDNSSSGLFVNRDIALAHCIKDAPLTLSLLEGTFPEKITS